MAKIEAQFSFYGINSSDEKLLADYEIRGLLKGNAWSYSKPWTKNEKRDFGKFEDNPADTHFIMYISVILKSNPNITSNVVSVKVDKAKFKDPSSDYKKISITFDKYYDENSTKAGAARTIIIGSGHPK
jgi:hypothetical protein